MKLVNTALAQFGILFKYYSGEFLHELMNIWYNHSGPIYTICDENGGGRLSRIHKHLRNYENCAYFVSRKKDRIKCYDSSRQPEIQYLSISQVKCLIRIASGKLITNIFFGRLNHHKKHLDKIFSLSFSLSTHIFHDNTKIVAVEKSVVQ